MPKISWCLRNLHRQLQPNQNNPRLNPCVQRLRAKPRRRIAKQMNHNLHFGGHRFVTAGDAALFWPQNALLLVADLHLEKASSYAQNGQMLPPYDSLATLEQLHALAQQFGVRRVICLGDNFHDSAGEARLSDKAANLLQALTARLDWTWITGNHDPALEALWGGHSVIEQWVDGIMMRHQADPNFSGAEMSGHFHPKLRVPAARRIIPRRCFVQYADKLIFPAFGALTGGMDAAEAARLVLPAITKHHMAEALIATPQRLARFTLNLDCTRAE